MYWSSCTPFHVIKSCNYVDLFLNFCYLMYWCYLLWRCDLIWLMWFDAVMWMKGRSPTALWIVLQWFRISPWMTRKQNSLLNDIVTTMTKMSKKLTKWWRFKNFYYDRIFLLWVITQEILKIRIRKIYIFLNITLGVPLHLISFEYLLCCYVCIGIKNDRQYGWLENISLC